MNFYDETIVRDVDFSNTGRVARADLLEPVTRAVVEALMKDAAALGQPLLLFETYRSQARQTALFKAHATQLSTVGVHHYGLAADLVKDVDGEPSWKGAFDFLGVLAHRHGLVWGGSWKGFPDFCHVQRVAVEDQPILFKNIWYPASDYLPFPQNVRV